MCKKTFITAKRQINFTPLSIALLFITLAITLISNIAVGQTRQSNEVELLGVALVKATRAELRAALRKNNIPVTREDNKFYCDIYKAADLLDEADELTICYVAATGKFASANYRLPSSLDVQQVQRAISLVSTKYGKPQSTSGSISLGKVESRWQLASIQIFVDRGWPDTTTNIVLAHAANRIAMRAEIALSNQEENRKAAEKQSRAF